MIIYETISGDMLDEIVYRFYGKTSGIIEIVLSENRHLSDLGDIYEAGVKIRLPQIVTSEIKKERSVWS